MLKGDGEWPGVDRAVVFVTGAASGFGAALVERFHEAGALVVLADIDTSGAQRRVSQLPGDGSRAMVLHCDVADERQVDEAMVAVDERFGRLDILINNAGLHLSKYNQPFGRLERREVRNLFEVNVMGVVNCSVAAADLMGRSGGGSILNIASIASTRSTTPYGISKLAVRGLTIAFANELAPSGIRVNAVSPGLIGTDNVLAALDPAFVRHVVEDEQLIHRLGSIADIVSAVMYLSSDHARFITGETLRVSGGHPLSI